jgi:tRNA pseudouridine38-40 synthase
VEGAGRTDAGVHALGAVAHADVSCVPERPRRRLNGVLPEDVRARGVAIAPPGFHARKSALSKRYAYRFRCDEVECPLGRRFAWHVGGRLDVEAMRQAAGAFVGERDFASLQSTGSSVATSRREITRCELLGEPPDVGLVVEGTGFLRHMVRTMAGSLAEVGRGRREPSWIEQMLAEVRRGAAGPTAPARGLVLEHVAYPEPIAGLLRRALAGEDPARIDA